MTLTIPNNWAPRPHQRPLYNSFGHGKRYQRASIIWHRRAGKDSCALNMTARDMFKRKGNYWHLFPEQSQARKAVWNGIDKSGRRILDQFLPPKIRTRADSQDMLIETTFGSTWQLTGSDRYDSLVGANPVGVVFTEWALSDPTAWDYIRPILVENGGWAMFITTPRGRNHAYTTHQRALQSDDWYAQRLTIEDTGLITQEQVQAERDVGMSEAKIAQEFYCDFEAEVEEQFIPSAAVTACRSYPAVSFAHDELVMGVDVARFGDDDSAIVMRRGRDARTIPAQIFSKLDTMQFAARVAEQINKHRPDGVFVDEGGLGAGVVDRLRQLGFDVTGINFGAKSDRFVPGAARASNKRGEMWSTMREAIKAGMALPDDDRLEFELLAPTYTYDAGNAIVLEKKADMKKRGVPSPDVADALALSFAYAVEPRSVKAIQTDYDDDNYDPIWS